MMHYSSMDCLRLVETLQKLAQVENGELPSADPTNTPMADPSVHLSSDPALIKSIAIKRLQAILADKTVSPGQPNAPGVKPGQAQNQHGKPGADISSTTTNAPLPLNNSYIDLKRIQDWLSAYNGVVDPQYQQSVKNALATLNRVVSTNKGHYTPINLSQPVDVIYTNVRDFFRQPGQDSRMAVDQPLIYLQELSKLIGDLVGVFDAYSSQFPMKEEALRQQKQFANYIQVELSSWMGQIPGVQERLDGRKR
jgi:hypothetical protein